MSRDIRIRKVRTASGAIALQLIRYEDGKRIILKHVGSAHSEEEIAVLQREAERLQDTLSAQLSFAFNDSPVGLMHSDHLQLSSVTHYFSYKALRRCSELCSYVASKSRSLQQKHITRYTKTALNGTSQEDYYQKNNSHYQRYKYGSGRVDRLKSLWGDKESH